jgi:hypothetical protein
MELSMLVETSGTGRVDDLSAELYKYFAQAA